MLRSLSSFVLFLMLSTAAGAAVNPAEMTVELDDGSEIPVVRFNGGGDRILWIPTEYGMGAAHRQLAQAIAEQGFDLWLADLHAAWFLIPGRSSYTRVEPGAVAELIEQAQPERGRLYLLSAGRGAALTLIAARQWRLARPDAPALGGAILLHPNLTAESPEPGQAPAYLPISAASNLPIYILQPLNSAKRWHMEEVMERLQAGGSTVYTRILPGAADGFQARADAHEGELAVRSRLPDMIRAAARTMDRHNGSPRPAVERLPKEHEWKLGALATTLQPYPGTPPAPAALFTGLDGVAHRLADYRGKVVLLNFWATWCPPCVEEVPSLGRLQARLGGDDFVVLGVDVGEPAETVRAFLERIPADYPVLLDPEGSAVDPWSLRAFPTTFLIDREGRIRYSYFGGLQWDNEEVQRLVRSLF